MKNLFFLFLFIIIPSICYSKEVKKVNTPDSVNVGIKSLTDYLFDSVHNKNENAIRSIEVSDTTVGTVASWGTLAVGQDADSIYIAAPATWSKYGISEFVINVFGDTCEVYFTKANSDSTRIGPFIAFPNTSVSDIGRYFWSITILPFNEDNGIIENKIYVPYYINGR